MMTGVKTLMSRRVTALVRRCSAHLLVAGGRRQGRLLIPTASPPVPVCQAYYATPQFKCLRIESQHTQTAFWGRFQDPLTMQTHQQQPRESRQLPNPKLKVPIVGSRASSPAPGVSRSAVAAQRATSPAPKKGSRGSTPSGDHGQRASSPLAGGAGSRAGSPLSRVPKLSSVGRPTPVPHLSTLSTVHHIPTTEPSGK